MTEIPGVTCNPVEGVRKPGSMGPIGRHPDPARPWAQCRVVDDEGRDVGVNEVGELLVKTPIIMQGYFRDPQQTKDAFEDGWFKTGDLVKRDEDGYFFFVSRKKDIIRRRGENIAGAELDRVIGSHPAVHEAAAIPVPAELGEDEILVAVVLKPGHTATAQDIAQWCREHLAPQKVPRYVLLRRRAAAHADAQGGESRAEERRDAQGARDGSGRKSSFGMPGSQPGAGMTVVVVVIPDRAAARSDSSESR